jgi:putative PIN family toxin of toxin-antitoxin system
VLRVVFDTNVFVSAVFGGYPEAGYRAVLQRRCRLVTSPAILAELARTLRKKLRTPEGNIVAYLRQIARFADLVRPAARLALARHDADNRVLECAAEGGADLIVSGDRDLLTIRQHAGIAIVPPAQLIRILGPPK